MANVAKAIDAFDAKRGADRTIYEHLIPEEGDNSELVFVGLGATYDVSDTVSAGLSYQTELNHLDTSNFHQAVLDVRLRF